MSSETKSQNQPVSAMALNAMYSQPNFARAVNQDIGEINNCYTNARYAPTGNEKLGKPFPAFKEFGGRFTQWRPTALSVSNLKLQANLPTNNTYFRQGIEEDAIGVGNRANQDWVASTQTLSNIDFSTKGATQNSECSAFGPKYKVNANFNNYRDIASRINQPGSSCSYTEYPELSEGQYKRQIGIDNRGKGGIGVKCETNSDCNQELGYECNVDGYNPFGSAVQQPGYCSQTYYCPGPTGKPVKMYVGYPWNVSIPKPPPDGQNNNGRGYDSYQRCNDNAEAMQDCVKGPGGKYFATYPAFCPIPALLRQNNNPQGALRTTGPREQTVGFTIPAYATNEASSKGGARANAFVSWNINSDPSLISGDEPLQYMMNMNPRPKNFQQTPRSRLRLCQTPRSRLRLCNKLLKVVYDFVVNWESDIRSLESDVRI